ncbi:AAA ATPase [Leptolyngbya sp. NIES-3755]|nr:AAA ATPase [Leptolyngbya sp. NIES-3755]
MSHSAFFSTIETALGETIVVRLILEECELLIGSEYGAILQGIPLKERSFEPISPSSSFSNPEVSIPQALETLKARQSIEIYGLGFAKIELLRSLSQQSELQEIYPHGILYLEQADPLEDLLQIIFERLYRVPSDVKPSRAEIRSKLSDRQALILLNHPNLTAAEIEQLQRVLPESRFAIASVVRRFSQANSAIELSDSEADFGTVSEQENAVLELLATVGVSLTAEQIAAITNISDLGFIQADQGRYKLWRQHRISESWMQKVLVYVLDWIRSKPDEIVQERELLMVTVQWAANQRRFSEVIKIVRSIEGAFASAKLWASWSKLLRWSLSASWALEDETTEAWALHQLGTLAFCQQEVTTGYDTLRDALTLRTELKEQTAIDFTTHNINQIKALIAPAKSPKHQRQSYWIVGVIFAIAVTVSIGVGIVYTQQRSGDQKPRSSLTLARFS